jgi:hypothetical protein
MPGNGTATPGRELGESLLELLNHLASEPDLDRPGAPDRAIR